MKGTKVCIRVKSKNEFVVVYSTNPFGKGIRTFKTLKDTQEFCYNRYYAVEMMIDTNNALEEIFGKKPQGVFIWERGKYFVVSNRDGACRELGRFKDIELAKDFCAEQGYYIISIKRQNPDYNLALNIL